MAELSAGYGMLDQLIGVGCARLHCSGSLEPGRYKGDVAVICTDCHTPAVRLWGDE